MVTPCISIKNLFSGYPLHIQIHCIQRTGFLDVYSVNSHEGVGHNLPAVGGNGVVNVVGHHVNAHPFVDADAVAVFHLLNCDSV